jgi:hypothetical protein
MRNHVVYFYYKKEMQEYLGDGPELVEVCNGLNAELNIDGLMRAREVGSIYVEEFKTETEAEEFAKNLK